MLQYLIPVALGIERFINSHQGNTIMVIPCPHHDTTTTNMIMSQNIIDSLTFIMMSIDSGMSICCEQHEARFIRKNPVFHCAHLYRLKTSLMIANRILASCGVCCPKSIPKGHQAYVLILGWGGSSWSA